MGQTIPLDDAAVEIIGEAIRGAETTIACVLAYFARQHGVKGHISLAPDRRSVVIGASPPSAPAPAIESEPEPLEVL